MKVAYTSGVNIPPTISLGWGNDADVSQPEITASRSLLSSLFSSVPTVGNDIQ